MTRAAALSLASALLALTAAPVHAAGEPQTRGGKEALDILKEAIEVPTVAGRGNVPKLAEKLKARFLAGGFSEQDIAFTPVGETGYMTVRYPGRDRKAKPLVVIAHMDVVEAKPEDWERDPFTAVIEDGNIFGRGSDDDKSGVAIGSAALLELKRQGWVPSRDVVFGISGDEETAMASTKAMSQTLSNADLVLNIDAGGGMLSTDNKPLFFSVQAGEKTYADYTLTMSDAGGHSSRPGSVDVIAEMGAALDAIWKHKFTPKLSPLTKAYLEGSAAQVADPKIAQAMRDFIADQSNAEAVATLSAEPEWIGVIRTTCVPTMIEGGHAPNALPQSVTANVNCRIFPGTSRDEIKAELAKIVANPKIPIAFKDNGTLESIESPLDDKVMAAVTKAVHENVPGLAVIPNMSAGATDSMHFRSQGIRAYGVTPTYMRSEDSFAHGLNERLPLATLDPGVKQMVSMLKSLAQ
jgi:carboxypeptidase PM20D1